MRSVGKIRSRIAKTSLGNYNFQDFEALMRILYQIRSNLFHGDKLAQNGYQNQRNQELVTQGNIVLRTILKEVAKSTKK